MKASELPASELFAKNQALAMHVAKKVAQKHPDWSFDDIRQGALIGLWGAATSFSSEYGTKFVTHAYRRIWGSALQHGAQSGFFGRYWRQEFKKETTRKGVKVRQVELVRENPDEENSLFSSQDDSLEHLADRDEVQTLLAHLPSTDRYILRAWMEGKTYKEIGQDLGVTRQRIEQRFRKGLARLQTIAGRLK